MRKTKTIKIDDKEITVKELRVKDIRKLMGQMETLEDDIFDGMGKFLPFATDDLKLSDLEGMAPSEIERIWDTFREVNGVFFRMMARMGVGEALKKSISSDLTAFFASSLKEATAKRQNTE